MAVTLTTHHPGACELSPKIRKDIRTLDSRMTCIPKSTLVSSDNLNPFAISFEIGVFVGFKTLIFVARQLGSQQ